MICESNAYGNVDHVSEKNLMSFFRIFGLKREINMSIYLIFSIIIDLGSLQVADDSSSDLDWKKIK